MTPDAKKKKKKTFSAAVVDNSAARSEKKTTPKVSGAVNAIVRGAKAGAAVTSASSKATGTAKKSTSRRMPVKSRGASTNAKRDFAPTAMDIGTMSWSDISSARRKREAAKRRDASALRKSALAPLDLTSGSVPDAYRLDTKKSTPTATPAPTAKPKPTAAPAPTVKPTPTATPAPTAKPTPTPTVTPNPTAKPAQSAPQPAQDEKINGLLMQFPSGGDAKSALDAANEKDAKRRTKLHEAAQRGDWTAFSVAGDKYAITRPDDAALLGAEVPSGADMLLGALTPDGFGKNGWQKREQGEMIYANDDGAASVEADMAERGGAFAAPDARKAAMDKTLGMLGVGKMDVVPGMQELPRSAEERRAKAEADKIWRGIEDEYVRSTPEYKAARAELDVQREGYARQLETVDALLAAQTEAGASDDQISDTKRQQRLLKKAIFDTDCETDALTGKVRAQQVDAGVLEGDVTDEERLKYGISPNVESDGSFFGELVANVERARFSGSASMIRKAQKELRGVCQLISNSTAAAKGYDTIYDYAAECSPTERTILMLGFDPSERMDDEEIDFGSEWWNTYQQINELVVDNGSDMAVSMMTGGGNKVLSGIINAALSAPDNFSAAVEEANNYGASAAQAEKAGLAEGTVNTVLDMWGYDKISSASKSLFSKVSSPGMRKLLHKGGLVLASHPGANALLNWLTGSVSEGAEEMGEDVVHGLVQRVVYDDTSEWVGEDGIFNLREIFTDGALGTAFGGFTTLIGGLGMDKGTHSREYAEEIVTDIGFGRDVDGKLTELDEMIEAEARTKERTAQDVEIHAAIWDDTGTERPETYAAWHNAAQEADAAHAQYQMAKRNLEDALTAADLGELNITTPQGVKTFRAAIKQVEKSKATYKKALAQDENARAKYYEDEDDLRAGMSAKRDALDEAAQRITKAVNAEEDVTNAGRRRAAVDINSPDVVASARNLRDSVMREVELRGQIDAAHADKDAAAGPMDIVEADRRAEALGAELEEAEQQSAEAETELRRAASSSADLDARMNALRQEAAGKAGYRQEYARMTDSELGERARLLEIQRSRLGKSLVDAHGVKVEEVRTKLKDVGERIDAVTREQEMRREVYGQMEYSVPEIVETNTHSNASTLSEARQVLDDAVKTSPLVEGHEYRIEDYDELARLVAADGGTHSAQEWEKILGFAGSNPRSTNLERYVHNTQERTRNRSKGVKVGAEAEVVSAKELLEFMRDEMMSDAAQMSSRKAQYERLMNHDDVTVHVLAEPTLKISDKYATAKEKMQMGDVLNNDTSTVIALNKEGFSKTLHTIGRLPQEVRPAALTALENYRTLMADSIYVGSYPDYGESAEIKDMHCFVAAFEYGGEQYKAMYTAKETRNNNGKYSTKLYLQRVEAIKAQKNAAGIEDQIVRARSGVSGINYIYPTADTIIASSADKVNTISAKNLLEGYNLNAMKSWPLAKEDAQSGSGTKIYRNGQLLFGDMTDDELAMLTAHVAQEAANEANAPVQGDAPGVPDADAGMPDAPEQPTAQERLDALREERRRRAQEIREQGATPQEAARQARMEEIRQTLEDVRAVSDSELAMQRNWLTRRMNTMSAEQDSAEVGQQSHEYEELRGYLDEIRTEETKRRDVRRKQASEIMHELDGERAIQAEADGRADEETVQAAQAERARIKDVQRDTRAQIEADNRRVTDTISLEEAAKTFDTGYTASDLRRNSERLAVWEQRRAMLAESIADMDRELKSIEGRRGRAADDESYAADFDGRPAANGDAEVRRENMLRRSLAAQRSAIKQVDRIIRYLDQHSADSVVDTLRSGHIAEPIMEKILGIVDGMHKDRASGLLGMHHSTPERVFDDYFGKASPVMRAIYLDPVHDAETQRTKFIDHCRERINALHLNALESELVQRYGEGLMTPAELAAAIDKKLARRGTKLKDGSGEWTINKDVSSAAKDMDTLSAEGWGDKADEVRRIQHAVAEFRSMYDQVWEMENDALIRNGYEGLGKRRQYFPHFQEKESTLKLIYDKITGKGSSEGENALPTEINGRTAGNSPSKAYDPHAQHRRGTQTTYDAIKGFEDYIDRSTKVAYHTDNIKRLRQLENSIRAGYKNSMLSGDKIGANFVIWLHEYSNLLANKHSNLLLDRASEATGGRIIYQFVDSLRSRRGAAAVAGNVGAALSNVAPVVQVVAEHPVSTVKGLMGWIMELGGGAGIPESGFIQRRQASGAMDVTNMGKVANAISKPFEFIDALATNIVVRANYYANLDAGMAPTDAMRSADAQSARLMADRSWGAMPNFYNNKTFMAVLGQFQLEVANTASWLGKDVIRTHGGMRAAGVYALSAVLYHLVNRLFEEKLTGNSLLPDPIGAVKEGIEVGQRDGIWEGILAGSRELADGLPYMGNGRIGTGIFDGFDDFINSGIKAVQTNDPADWNNLFWYATNYITYGGQFKKIYQGAGALMQDGVYNRNGQLMYPIDTSDDWTKVQTVLFGKNSTAYARQYWDEGRQALSDDNTSLYERAVQEGMSPAEAYEHMYSYQAAKTANSEYKKLLAAGDIEGAQKALMERDTQMQGANYDMLVPDDMRGGVMPQKTMDMLEMAWREDMDSKWLPGSSSTKYNGSFKKDGADRKFTNESMEILQRVAQKELAARLERYADEWPQMTNEERATALKVCTSGKTEGGDKIWPSSVWVAAKEYGLKNGLKYTTSDEYKAAHEGDEETVYTNPEKGLTNPIQDAIGWVRDKLGFGEGEQQNAAVLPETQVQPDAATDADILPEYEPQQPGSGRKSSGGRGGRSGGRMGGSRGHGSGMTVGIPGATVTIPWHRTRLGEAFGAGYDPVKSGLISPLSNSFTLGGANYTLSDEQMTQYTGVYDAYMDMYLRERQADWDAADAAGREQIYREVDERARAAAQQHWAELR
jgi:hypothetical protein